MPPVLPFSAFPTGFASGANAAKLGHVGKQGAGVEPSGACARIAGLNLF